ncbi:MAG: hypothetical protein ABL914_09720 [Novosphingobium sp.]|uniref:hypothetical protein n=1 Tax=Novosphingobium sp. TaxID=1874826 RepID=UPI0032B974C6
MNGQIFQILVIALNGNALCEGHSIERFGPDSSAFMFEHETTFHELDRTQPEEQWTKIFTSPKSWLDSGRQECCGYRVHFVSRDVEGIPDRSSSAFAGGGSRWLLEQVHDGSSSLWESSLELTHPDAPNRRIWSTRYHCIEPTWTGNWPAHEIQMIRAEFRLALEQIRAFAASIDSGFSSNFESAIDQLDAKKPAQFVWNQNALPDGLGISLEARQLLAAAQKAWVFGGMGSWNDLYLPDQDIQANYDRVSSSLFTALQNALVCAVNSTCSCD